MKYLLVFLYLVAVSTPQTLAFTQEANVCSEYEGCYEGNVCNEYDGCYEALNKHSFPMLSAEEPDYTQDYDPYATYYQPETLQEINTRLQEENERLIRCVVYNICI